MLNDYDYMKPPQDLKAKKTLETFKPELEIYDHPGNYIEKGEGERLANVRLQAEQALDQRRHCAGAAASMLPGGTIKLSRHPTEDGEYLVVRSSHTFVTEHYRSGASAISDQAYYGNYEILPKDKQFRAPLVTPRAVVQGPHTALVVAGKNAQGEEIDVDEHGRILVHFYWEREGNLSRRARVAQLWSGKGWGHQFIPRVGMEVVVIYEEGDPDHPLVIGCVYNGDNKYPYKLEADKTQSGVKSNSSKEKDGKGYNEFMFEDLATKEYIRMHAQKNYNVKVLDSEEWDIASKFSGDRKPARNTTIHHNDDKLYVKDGNQEIEISKDQTVKIGVHQKVDVGMTIDVKAGQSIKLHVGGSNYVEITPAGVTIKGTLVLIN
jgi:type VI secretion system secreted protein VgrG